jgi:hypothetical protein
MTHSNPDIALCNHGRVLGAGDCPPCTEEAATIHCARPRRVASVYRCRACGQPCTLDPGTGDVAHLPVPPSRLYATPDQVHAFLLEHFCEDVLLRYQQAVGRAAVVEAVDDITANSDTIMASHTFCQGMKCAADHVDPRLGAGHWPSSLVAPPTTHKEG